MSFSVGVGGMAIASFPGNEAVHPEALAKNTNVPLVWDSAIFYGEHWLLGPIVVKLPTHTAAPSATGVVRSLQTETFFPALNRNTFNFQIELPRLGVLFTSKDPMVNEAQIQSIPPFQAEYKLVQPLKYTATAAQRRTLFATIAGDIVLETCTVKLMELKNIQVVIKSAQRTSENDIIFEAEFLNQTTEENITVTWLLWPQPAPPDSVIGSIKLDRTAKHLQFTVPEKLFNVPRALAVALSEPFETDAATAVQLVL
jgi:hypothetical protein